MKLLLFDIDGTLLRSSGAGREAIHQALASCCGRPLTTDGISFSGKTDPQIVDEILEANACDTEGREKLAAAVLDAYASLLETHLDATYIDVLPGVHALLERLATLNTVQLGLLTGNLERTGYLKLEVAALDTYFPFGAFGSDHADRNRLPTVAIERAHAHTGRSFSGRDVIIIGDTEHDIRCGQAVGAASVAVCTGRYTRADLTPCAPDLLLDDLSDGDAFYEQVIRAAL